MYNNFAQSIAQYLLYIGSEIKLFTNSLVIIPLQAVTLKLWHL